MVHSVMVKVSPKQMSKLRNGHKVRVKPPTMEGEGVCLIVDPGNYSLLSRTFNKNKGAEISLTPNEILANKEASTQMEGKGIFGTKFDRGLKKLIGKKAVKDIYNIAEQFLPMAQGGLTAGLTAGATALGGVQPELIPFLPAAVSGLSTLGSDYLANPGKYQGRRKASSLAKEYAKNMALQQLNQQLGTNMGDLSRASLNKAAADKVSSELAKYAIQSRQQLMTQPETYSNPNADNMLGNGLYASKSGGAVGVNGGFVRRLPPALQSQPYSANFQFQATLPPAYQKFSKGNGLYV
jgi:hypothetical protein